MTIIPETPESVLAHILNKVRDSRIGAINSAEYREQFISGFDGCLAADYDYDDLFMLNMLVKDLFLNDAVTVPPAVIINNDAYIYMDNSLIALILDVDGRWKLRISLSMCWGCFGDHSQNWNLPLYVPYKARRAEESTSPSHSDSVNCWGVLCECCGGTGWEGGNLDYCAAHELSMPSEVLTSTASPREAFLAFRNKQLPVLQPILGVSELGVSWALVRGGIAKIEVTTSTDRYLALMKRLPTNQWSLSGFFPLCSACRGHGIASSDSALPCRACGGLKWGNPGDLRYCRNDAPGSWEVYD